jgi:hypothetical protein
MVLLEVFETMTQKQMARLRRFELLTSGSGDQRSIQLSYRRAAKNFGVASR